ncbi:hypothetical protein MtrunA17_Chr3g0083451 [Medicago truncatula]|uniref:Transmembrane protein, putative n=2 Tax=Medicago truncatula TaxID=3880 RepID=G7IYU6_MEDTR|nr:transmembrane protein, putative [Medicago truncatula]KEH33045.1 transmembrane protein, putative [Medicago truncatula]RHN65752.1 hypothetical protein MtrunA17_Chr3g0083381 [Medicago truncatula]RHN65754.1 hypothetical protein MtrunA17_Chr3g0083421 [Medicago truncatula]RHN65757.1 hypothetical protein MtrunA17_Chr3g0083451 [Medicago truncatula]
MANSFFLSLLVLFLAAFMLAPQQHFADAVSFGPAVEALIPKIKNLIPKDKPVHIPHIPDFCKKHYPLLKKVENFRNKHCPPA